MIVLEYAFFLPILPSTLPTLPAPKEMHVFAPRKKSECESCIQLSATPRTVACQAPLSMAFSRQEHWSGLPFPPPGNLPNPGIEPMSLALQADSLPSEPPGMGPKTCISNNAPAGRDVPFVSSSTVLYNKGSACASS